jgi:hypothetical protein
MFDATLGPVMTDCRLAAALNAFSIRFALPLPQHDHSNPTTETFPNGTAGDPPPTFLTVEQELASSAILAASQPTDGADFINARDRLTQLQLQGETIMKKTRTPCRLFQSTSVPGTFMSLSSKMARILTCESTPGTLPTYLGSLLLFLDDQATFNDIFPTPTPLEEDGSPSDRTCSTSISSRIAHFLYSCELDLCASILHLDYVGTTSATNPETICQISDRLRRLSSQCLPVARPNLYLQR